jgi:hypothetical protein
MLQQAADVARRNEERAKAQVRGLSQDLRAAERRIQELEAALDGFERRAVEAEEWLLRIFHEVKTKFVEPFTDGARLR